MLRARSRRWTPEVAIYFYPANETLIVEEIGAVAVEGILAGRSELEALEAWCREHGFADAGEDLRAGLSNLLAHLASLEVIVPDA